MQATAAVRRIAGDNARAVPIFLAGVAAASLTGNAVAAAAAAVPDVPFNALLDPSKEISKDGRVIYVKRGDASVIIEHRSGSWCLKARDSKVPQLCLARMPGGCALEACVSHVWYVNDGALWVAHAGVRMALGADAERWVSAR